MVGDGGCRRLRLEEVGEGVAPSRRQVERRQLFLRSYHFSRDIELSPRARTRRLVSAGLGMFRLCFARVSHHRNIHCDRFRYSRLCGVDHAPAAASVCFW
uniref:Uncharacterized protein n=1 Tax=Oryza barthii TaxID=65489 RepID=A0A0D3G2Z1_9ORYZ